MINEYQLMGDQYPRSLDSDVATVLLGDGAPLPPVVYASDLETAGGCCSFLRTVSETAGAPSAAVGLDETAAARDGAVASSAAAPAAASECWR